MWEPIVKILLTLLLAGVLIGLLPESPFADAIANLGQIPYIAEVNWFFPIGRMLEVLTAWAVCMGIYYGIAWILRQLNIVGD